MSPPSSTSGDGQGELSRVRMDARVSGHGRAFQSAGDQTVYESMLPPEALRPITEVAAPPGTVSAPGAGQLFVGRTRELAALEATLQGGPHVAVTAVHGLGGIGKSTLVSRYITNQRSSYTLVWWIVADSAAAVQAALARMAVALQPELAVLPSEALAERALAWLATHPDWLVVADNVNDPADVAPLLDRTRTGRGRVVVTSRLGEGWHRLGARVLRLDVLDENDAIELLVRIAAGDDHYTAPGGPCVIDGAAELVRELGCLPLAVEQAAAYLHQNRMTPHAYLALLAEHPAAMYDQAARGFDAERTIARIWRLTLGTLADTPLAGHLLRVLAWYASDDIPRSLLQGAPSSLPGLQRAAGDLAAYNMITLQAGGVTVHRLVQAVARTPDPTDPHRRAADIDLARDHATALLQRALPHTHADPTGWPTWRTLLPHITALITIAPPSTDTIITLHLLNSTGLFLSDQGAMAEAINTLHRARTASERVLGADHPETLASRSNLAIAYRLAGDLGRAISLHEATLAERERVLGADHPDTLASCGSLGHAYRLAGDLGRALALLETTLAACERVLGADHPQTLASRNNLAGVYETAGHLDRAVPLYEACWAACERVLGTDHPTTLVSRNNLAAAYREAGDLGRAIPLCEATLAVRERVLGTDHPDTLVSRNNLAAAYREAGDLRRAIPLLETTLAACERVLDASHPHTLASRNNLAYAYRVAGDLRRAIALYEVTLAERERALGVDHPDTLISRNNLAYAYGVAADMGRAIPLFESNLAACERVLGADHPVTKSARANLTAAVGWLGT